MACKCKVDRDIEELYKHYGSYNGEKKKKRLFENFSLWRTLVVIITLPFMLLIMSILSFKKKPIKISKLVKAHN